MLSIGSKYLFFSPAFTETYRTHSRLRNKLNGRPGIAFPDSLVGKIVELTEGFSFAYMKEAFVSTLLLVAAGEGGGDSDDEGVGASDDEGVFERIITQQLKNLKLQIRGPVSVS